MRPTTYIYVAEVPCGMLKIGISERPRVRLLNHRGRILGLCLGNRYDEAQLHVRFRPFLVQGKEWYSDCPEIRAFAASMTQTTLPLPSRLMVGRSGRNGSWPSVKASEATWAQLQEFAAFQSAELNRLLATLEDYEAEIERVRPFMEADPAVTYADACAQLGLGSASKAS